MRLRARAMIAFAGWLAACSAAVGAASPPIHSQKDFQNLLDRISAAERARDFARWKTLILSCSTPGATVTTAGKTLTYPQIFAEQEREMRATRSLTADSYAVKSFDAAGGTAKSVVVFRSAGTAVDETGDFGPKGKLHTFDSTATITYDLVSTPRGWKVAKVDSRIDKMSWDGNQQPAPPAPSSATPSAATPSPTAQ